MRDNFVGKSFRKAKTFADEISSSLRLLTKITVQTGKSGCSVELR